MNVVFSAFFGQLYILLFQIHRLLGDTVDSDDDGVVFDEGQQAELLVAVMDLYFPDVPGDFLKEFFRDDRIGIFLEKPHAHCNGLGSIIVERVQPFGDRLFPVGGLVELNDAVFSADQT